MRRIARLTTTAILGLLAGCGGGGDTGGGAPPPAPAPAPAPAPGIGTAGGTVSDTSGAKVVVPAGALTTNTAIAVAQSATGAPALPAGVTAAGPIFAFTPHGTTFATPVTITVPFDPTSVATGLTPALYKTNATQSGWEMVSGATVDGSTMQGNITSFSYVTVVQISQVQKSWQVDLYRKSDGNYERHADGSSTLGVENVGFLGFTIPTSPATWWVHSTEAGRTFWTQAVAPLSDADYLGVRSSITLTYYFRVEQDAPTLNFLITHASITAFDDAGALPNPRVCPWLPPNPTDQQLKDLCNGHMTDAVVAFRIIATGITNHFLFYRAGGELQLTGRATDWRPLLTGDLTEHELFHQSEFEFDDDVDKDGKGRSFLARLREPKRVEVPLYGLNKGDIFSVQIFARTSAINRIQGESLVGALLQDPLDNVGIDLESEGLTEVPPQEGTPASAPTLSCTTGPDPAAGLLEFRSATFAEAERSDSAAVIVQRSGGTTGDVGVRVQSADAGATAGGDYEPVSVEVRFADGESGSRRVELPLLNDDIAEDEETVGLALSEVGGCAQLGAQSTATLTILDDDRPLPPTANYTVSGTVSGLIGGGLVLKELGTGDTVAAVNGAFSLPHALPDGTHYDIRVDTQPGNPVQQCTIAHGAGTLAGADVADVEVSCAAPAPSGGLDATFGSGGRVATDFQYTPGVSNARIGMALQADGKILLVGGLTLLRFNTDGTLDAGFGSGGEVHVPFTGSGFDTAQDVAVQADGKIVVAGFSSTLAGQDDFALVRFDSSGALDGSFGTGGMVITDFSGSTDRARRIRIQPDGKLLVAGFMTVVIPPSVASESFALARYNTDGSLDTGYATGGMTHDSPAGSYDYAQGLAIQDDGKVVLVGGAANDGVSDPDVGIVRYLGDTGLGLPGWRDDSFGALGNGLVQSDLGLATGFEEASDVVITADGSLMIAARVRAGAAPGGSDFGFTLVSFGSDGRQKGGALITKFSDLSDNARSMLLQGDGKIVVVGQSANLSTNPDMAIVRYAATGGAYDTSFGTDGKLTVDFFGGIDGAEAVAQQPDGKLIVGGFARFNGKTVLALARLMP